MKRNLLFLLLPFAASFACFAQSVTSLQGRVSDPSGALIPQAHVKITLLTTGATREDDTDASGNFQFQQLMPGTYSVRIDASGFTPMVKENVILQVASPGSLNVTLSVAAATVENVEVSATGAALLNTVDATLGNTFDSRQVSTLPIEGRNVVELLSLQPGVTFLGKNAGNSDSDSRSGSVNGSRSDQSNITLDGIDVNDENSGYAFTSVLRVTQDSIAEFRVTTSNPNADAGRGSGAQVALVTKSGTNQTHGTLYEYNRNVAFAANDYFNKQTQIANGVPNQPDKLIRNVFGASIGGPVWHNRVFYFANYEGERRIESRFPERIVPTASFRQGTLQYQTDTSDVYSLTPDKIQGMDPLHVGNNAAILQLLQSYPLPNDPTAGDGLNTAGYRFSQPVKSSLNTYVARLDWNISQKHTVFWRGNLLNDDLPDVSQFPGQPISTRALANNKGFGIGYTYVISPSLVNNFRWGLTRQGGSNAGLSDQTQVNLEEIDSPVSFSRTGSNHIPVNNFVDDVSWTRKNHNLSFGTDIRHIDDWRSSTYNSFPSASINIGWMQPSGFANVLNAPFNPPDFGYPGVAASFSGNYDDGIMDLVGLVDEVDAIYNFDKTGKSIPLGNPLKREYKWNEYDFYAQDSWRATKDLTLTFGLHYSYLQPPTEVNGSQVGTCVVTNNDCVPYSLKQFYDASYAQGSSGGAASNVPTLSFDLNGRSNHRADFWKADTKDLAPRLAFAWSPTFNGGAGKTSIRGGYSLVFDHFGAGIVNSFDTAGSFGFSSNVSNPAGSQTVTTSPRFQGISTIPSSLIPSAPVGGFPATPDTSSFAISWGLDSTLKTPYEHVIDLSVQRQLNNKSSLEVAYVGRLAHRLLEQEDVAMPLNLTAAGTDYFSAASKLSAMTHEGVPVEQIGKIPYWEALFAPLAGQTGFCDPDTGPSNPTATQNVYCIYQQNIGNETNALFTLDLPGNGTGAGDSYPAYRFYHDQYSALYAWRSIGQSNYHALEVTYRQHFGSGLEADFNYTYSHSIDWTSQAERLATSGGNNGAQIMNSWKPDQLRGTSDFDMTHQLNANWIWDIPIGRKRRFLGTSNRLVDGVIGGWQLTGIFRLTSGLPYAVDDGSRWPTNWDIEGFATLKGKIPSAALKRGHGQQRYADPVAVYNSFRQAYPGESGNRNPMRGDGFYDWDAGLNKTFQLYERAHLQFRWETFNLTNSVRFDPQSISSRLDAAASFGNAFSVLTAPRVMQVAARIEF